MYNREKGVMFMAFSYKPLWKKLIDLNMTKKSLMDSAKISKSTMDKMSRGEFVSMEILDRICTTLECNISDVVEHTSESK